MARRTHAASPLLKDIRRARMRFERAVLKIRPAQTAAIARLMSSIDAMRVARLAIGAH